MSCKSLLSRDETLSVAKSLDLSVLSLQSRVIGFVSFESLVESFSFNKPFSFVSMPWRRPLLAAVSLSLVLLALQPSAVAAPLADSAAGLCDSSSEPRSSVAYRDYPNVACLCIVGSVCRDRSPAGAADATDSTGSHCQQLEPSRHSLQLARSGYDPRRCDGCQCLAAADSAEASSSQLLQPLPPLSARNGMVVKRAYSSLRFVFFAGLEGTGHHRWAALWQQMHALPQLYNYTLTYKNTSYGAASWASSQRSGIHLYHTMRDDKAPTLLQDIRGVQRSLVQMSRRAPVQSLFWLNAAGDMMSFPGYFGARRVYQHPDLILLARIAESVGADLRIVVMLRDPAELWESSSRRFFKTEEERRLNIRLYNLMLDNLLATLVMLDPRFIACEHVDEPEHGTEEGLLPLMSFLHRGLNPEGTRLAAAQHRDEHAEESGQRLLLQLRDLGPILEEMRAKTLRLRGLCAQAARMQAEDARVLSSDRGRAD